MWGVLKRAESIFLHPSPHVSRTGPHKRYETKESGRKVDSYRLFRSKVNTEFNEGEMRIRAAKQGQDKKIPALPSSIQLVQGERDPPLYCSKAL